MRGSASGPEALWRSGYRGEGLAHLEKTLARVWEHAEDYDVIHSHVETALHLIATDLPAVFSARGRKNLWTLSKFRDESLIRSSYDNVSACHPSNGLFVVMKLDRREKDQYWNELFEFAKHFPRATMTQIVDEYLNRSKVS